MADRLKLLVVDDEDGLRTLLKSELDSHGYITDEADGGNMALEMLKKNQYNLVILDIRMPDLDGISVLQSIRSTNPQIKVIMLTGVGEMKLAQECVQLGAADFLTKPLELKNIIDCIERVMKE
jgi:DNA-binding NtrC family response regulator